MRAVSLSALRPPPSLHTPGAPARRLTRSARAPGLDNVYIKPGTKLLYLGGASGTTVSHCSDIVGPTGEMSPGAQGTALPAPARPTLLASAARPLSFPTLLTRPGCAPLRPPRAGLVYAVEFSHRSGRDLVNMAKKRTNVIPIIEARAQIEFPSNKPPAPPRPASLPLGGRLAPRPPRAPPALTVALAPAPSPASPQDARHPQRYRMLMGMVDTVFADVAQPDQARIVALNASYFLKAGGNFVISIKATCIDSTAPAEAVFAREVKTLQAEGFKPTEQLTLEPYERDHAIVVGSYRVPKKKKAAE